MLLDLLVSPQLWSLIIVLAIAAGMAGIDRIYFPLFVLISKVIRNWLLVPIIARVI